MIINLVTLCWGGGEGEGEVVSDTVLVNSTEVNLHTYVQFNFPALSGKVHMRHGREALV